MKIASANCESKQEESAFVNDVNGVKPMIG